MPSGIRFPDAPQLNMGARGTRFIGFGCGNETGILQTTSNILLT
jgi:hypothetical protein